MKPFDKHSATRARIPLLNDISSRRIACVEDATYRWLVYYRVKFPSAAQAIGEMFRLSFRLDYHPLIEIGACALPPECTAETEPTSLLAYISR